MNSFVWFELPIALSDLSKAILPSSDLEYINILIEESKVR